MKTLRWLFLMFCMSISGLASAADAWRSPAPYPIGMDTWYGSFYNTTAQHDYRLRVGGWGDIYNTLLRFDLSGLPQTADRVVIWLHPINEGAPTSINWNLVGKQWQSSTLTNKTLSPSDLYGIGQTKAPAPFRMYGVIITGIYNHWRTGAGARFKNHGLLLSPVSNNNNYSTFSSSTQGGGHGPLLQVTYTPQANDNVIKLKWPLGTPYANRVVTQEFNVNWAGGSECPVGVIKKHNGTDYRATAGTAVYAAEDGVVKHIQRHDEWASHIVIEHNHPTGGKYTTVYWHVNPTVTVMENDFVPKGMQIATVANIATGPHLHFGLRNEAYNENVSGTGALPQATCADQGKSFSYPGFPENFVDPNNVSNVLFQ